MKRNTHSPLGTFAFCAVLSLSSASCTDTPGTDRADGIFSTSAQEDINSPQASNPPAVGVYDGVAPDDRKTVPVGDPAVADPGLVPALGEKVTFPPGAGLEEKIALLAAEVERLKRMESRATVIVRAELELAEAKNQAGATVALEGGRLSNPIPCTSNLYGTCVFLVDPLADTDPPYQVRISAPTYQTVIREFRVAPAAVAEMAIRVELETAAREARIHPRLE